MEERVGLTVDATWIYGLRYIDDVIMCTSGSNGETQTLYALQDTNWNVVALVTPSGVVAERLTYDSFGKPTFRAADFTTKASSSCGWSKTFTGQVYDVETGLMLYRNRYYHTGLGRFITRDPIGYRGKDVDLYRYVQNSAMGHMDIFGLISCVGSSWVGTGYLFSTQLFLGYATGQVEFKCTQSHVVGIRTCSVGPDHKLLKYEKEIYAIPVVQADVGTWLAGLGLGMTRYWTLFRVGNAPDEHDLSGHSVDVVSSIGLGAGNLSGSWTGNGGSADVGPSGVGADLCSLQYASITVTNSFYQYAYEGLTVQEAQCLSERRAAGEDVRCSNRFFTGAVYTQPVKPTVDLSVSEVPR